MILNKSVIGLGLSGWLAVLPLAHAAKISGVTVYEPRQLLQYAEKFASGQGVGSPAGVAQAIELIYREDGYFLAEVQTTTLPGGEPAFAVYEGVITQITVLSEDPKYTERIHRYLDPLLNRRALRRSDFERAFALSDDLSGVDLSSRFYPSTDGIGSTLQISASRFKHHGAVGLDFIPLRPGYSTRLYAVEERYGLFNSGDMTRLYVAATREPDEGTSVTGNLFYRTPVGNYGNYLEAYGGNAFSQRTFSSPSVRSDLRGTNAGLAFGHPYYRSLQGYGYLIGEIDFSRSERDFGNLDVDSEALVARLYAVRGWNGNDGRLTQASVTLSVGRRPDGPISQPEDGDAEFTHIRASIGVAGPFTVGDTTLGYRLEGAMQWSPDALPAVEGFYLGHYPFLRGYAQSEVQDDNGVAGVFEVSRQANAAKGITGTRPFAFIAAGHVASNSSTTPDTSWTLASTGIGIRTPLGNNISLESWVAMPLRDGPLSEKGDPLFYLQIAKGW